MLQKKNEGILFSAEIRVVGSYTDRLLTVLIWEEILFPIEKSQCCMFPNVNLKCILLTQKNVTLFVGDQEKQ